MSAEPRQILLVEDDHVDVVLTQRALNQCRTEFKLVNCSTVADALNMMARHQFHAVLLDLMLPDSTGLDGLRQLLSVAPETPFVVLSGLSHDEWAFAVLEAGSQDRAIASKYGLMIRC
jgi:DNA-binding response OmpR family regulator